MISSEQNELKTTGRSVKDVCVASITMILNNDVEAKKLIKHFEKSRCFFVPERGWLN